MQELEQIDDTLKTIFNVWKKYPMLRLGQLISNAIQLNDKTDMIDLFYIENELLINMLNDFDMNIERNWL